jgi:O-antigen ligase
LAYYAQFVITCLMLAFMVLFSRYSYSHENGEVNFVGMFPTKNTCGAELSFGFTICGLMFRLRLDEKKPLPITFFITIGGLIILLMMSKAVGALICAVVPLSYLFVFKKKMRLRLPLGVIYPLVSGGFLIIAMTILPLFKPLFDALGKDITLTNRTDIWNRIIFVMSNNRSLLGYGFQLFWYNESASRLFKSGFVKGSWLATAASSCHNTILEMWCDLGLIGVALYFFSLLRAYSRIRELSEKQYCASCTILLWFMMMGLTERLFSTFNFQSLFFFLAMAIACDLPDQRKNEGRTVKPRNRREPVKDTASPG